MQIISTLFNLFYQTNALKIIIKKYHIFSIELINKQFILSFYIQVNLQRKLLVVHDFYCLL